MIELIEIALVFTYCYVLFVCLVLFMGILLFPLLFERDPETRRPITIKQKWT